MLRIAGTFGLYKEIKSMLQGTAVFKEKNSSNMLYGPMSGSDRIE